MQDRGNWERQLGTTVPGYTPGTRGYSSTVVPGGCRAYPAGTRVRYPGTYPVGTAPIYQLNHFTVDLSVCALLRISIGQPKAHMAGTPCPDHMGLRLTHGDPLFRV